jgi:uridine kinase
MVLEQAGIDTLDTAALKVNNALLPLSARLEVNATLTLVALDSPEGMTVFRRSLAFLLAVAVRRSFPQLRLYIGHSLGNSYYYTFAESTTPPKEELSALLTQLKAKMQALVKADIPIRRSLLSYSEALLLFEQNRQIDTKLLFDERSESTVPVNICDDFVDLYVEPLVPKTGMIRTFDLMPYRHGFLLLFPGLGRGMSLDPFEDLPVIFSVYNEYKKWGQLMGVQAVGHLNRLVSQHRKVIKEYIGLSEAFQDKKLSEIADQIYAKKDRLKIVLIAGPSSSGKTTTSKKLSIALKVLGIQPVSISLDDYYRGADHVPYDENGEPDLECLEALDVPYLNEQLLALFRGEEVTLPDFDFKSSKRRETGKKKIRLSERTVLILEGIHGLNDALTPEIDPAFKFKLYISALTQLNLDDHNRIPTSDNRLLRRIVRDYQFRGNSAAATIKMWPSVRRGEQKHIFPFQNGADAAFNSALTYELAVLKFYAEPLLHSVKPNVPEYAEAVRLLSFLENFAPIPPQYVPGQSILREFIGESEFKY